MNTKPIRPMLGVNVDLDRLKYPVIVSPKLDGIRAIVKDGVVCSRSGKPIPNKHVQKLFSPYHGLDGELIVDNPTDKNVFQNTVSGVMTEEDIPNVFYYVFDLWNTSLQYKQRLGILSNIVKNINKTESNVIKVESLYCNSLKEVELREQQYLQQGYEGLIIRNPNSYYKNGRSTLKEGGLLKLKRFKDGEAEVFGYSPLLHNNNPEELDELGYTVRSTSKSNMVELEALGSLEVLDIETGVAFNIGSGFTANQRKELWKEKEKLLGKIVKYKYFDVSILNAPRFPIFLGFRNKEDM